MNRALTAFAAALSYFTILPLGLFRVHRAPDADAIAALPYVGVVVGALAGASGSAVFVLSHRTLWAAIVAWIVSLALTGAIHVDGFLDCCDGLLASVTPERRLEIMRDPRHGTYALCGMAVLCAVWIGALFSLAPLRFVLTLAFTETLGRACALVNAYRFPYERTENIAPSAVLFALGAVAVLGWFAVPYGVVVAAGTLLVTLGIGGFCARRLGGTLTGDCYGAIACIGNAIALVASIR